MEPLGATIFFAFDGINALSVFHPKDMVESWTVAAEAAGVELELAAAAAALEAAAELRVWSSRGAEGRPGRARDFGLGACHVLARADPA